MIKEEKILIGTKEELVNYFYDIIKDCKLNESSESPLYTKDEIYKQLLEIEEKSKGTRRFYYLDKKEIINGDNTEIEFKFKGQFVSITDIAQ